MLYYILCYVVMHILPMQIAYTRRHTREFCSKPGRELLSSIAAQHPSVLSMLLKVTKDSMDSIGMVTENY